MDLNWTQESHGDILTDHDDKNSKEERTKKKKTKNSYSWASTMPE